MNERARILVVDENDDSSTMMAALLGQAGYAIETAQGVAAGLKLAHDKQPTLCIIESHFSDGRGSEMCRHIRALNPQAAVIFYTCAFSVADFEEALRAGANAYVVKPGIDELLQTIASLICRTGASQPLPLF